MKIFITNTFKRTAKKLHRDQITVLEKAIKEIKSNPQIGELKLGDLVNIRVYKFHISHQLILLAYSYDQSKKEVTLLSFGTHENFYKNLKNQIH